MPVKIIVCFIVGYLFGNIQTAFFIGKAHGIDIRRYGSGNAGTTNAMRTLGRKSGSLVFIGDLLKVLVPGMILRYAIYPDEPYVILLCEILGFGAVSRSGCSLRAVRESPSRRQLCFAWIIA